jgi:CHAD domain-containing protein
MSTTTTQFTVPRNRALSALRQNLTTVPGLQYEGRLTVERTFFDTFDWLLYNAKQTLEQEVRQQHSQLRLRPLCGDQSMSVLIYQDSPGLVCDLPQGVFRRQLEKIIDVRRVLPLFRMRSTQHQFSLRDEEDKVRLRLVIEQNTLLSDKGTNRSLGKRLRLQPLRGYSGELGQMIEFVLSELKLQPVAEDILEKGLLAIGRKPNDYVLKQEVQISRNMAADTACRKILQSLLDIVRRNEDGIRNNIDAEFLHDYRVAARAARAIFMQCKKRIDPGVSQHLIGELKWLGEVTGPLRDADVYLQQMPKFEQQLPDKLIAGLDIFKQHLHEQHSMYLNKVCEMLDSRRYHDFFKSCQEFILETSIIEGMPTILDHTNSRINKMYRRALDEGKAINDASPDEDLHELRKTCKKLRYLLEYMQNLYDKKSIRGITRALKNLQNNLGEFQDLCVQIDTLSHFNDTLIDIKKNRKSKKALARLIQQMQQRKQSVRKEFHKVFTDFDTSKTHELLDELVSTSTELS